MKNAIFPDVRTLKNTSLNKEYAPKPSRAAKKRFAQLCARMEEFLRKTKPDAYCYSYMDKFIDQEQEILLASLRSEHNDHVAENREIIQRRKADLRCVKNEKDEVQRLIKEIDKELEKLGSMYYGV